MVAGGAHIIIPLQVNKTSYFNRNVSRLLAHSFHSVKVNRNPYAGRKMSSCNKGDVLEETGCANLFRALGFHGMARLEPAEFVRHETGVNFFVLNSRRVFHTAPLGAWRKAHLKSRFVAPFL